MPRSAIKRGIAICLLAISGALAAQPAGNRIIQDATLDRADDCGLLTIHFALPMQYVSHFPAGRPWATMSPFWSPIWTSWCPCSASTTKGSTTPTHRSSISSSTGPCISTCSPGRTSAVSVCGFPANPSPTVQSGPDPRCGRRVRPEGRTVGCGFLP